MLGAPAKMYEQSASVPRVDVMFVCSEEVAVRRSSRATKKQVASSPPSSDSDSDSDQSNESTVDNVQFELVVSPSKPADVPTTKRLAPEGGPSASGKDLYDQLCAKGTAMKLVVDEWMQEFSAHESTAVLQLVNTIIRTGTIGVDLEMEAFADEEEEPSEILSAFQDALDSSMLRPSLLIGKKKACQQFNRSFTDFWSKWAQSVYVNLAGASDRLVVKFVPWLVLLSTSMFRPLRQAAAMTCFSVLVGLAKAAGELSAQLERATRITRNAKTASGLADVLTGQLASVEKTIQHLFSTVYIQRFRDVDKEVRRAALEQLGLMIQTQPGLFLDNHYLRYLGWGLSDKTCEVRLAAVQSLDSLYRDRNNHAPMKAFTERFKERLSTMAYRDIDEEVRGASQSLFLRLFHSDLVQVEELGFVDHVARAMVPLGKEGSALLFARCFAAAKDESDPSLVEALNAYITKMTSAHAPLNGLYFIEYLVKALAPSVPWLGDIQQATQMDLSWPLLEAVFRHAVYPACASRVTPTRPSGLEASARLSDHVMGRLIEALCAPSSHLALLAMFETVSLLDTSAGPSATLTDAVVAAFTTTPCLNEDVLTAGISALRFLRSSAHLTSRIEAALEHQVQSLVASVVRHIDEETEEVKAALYKASLLGSLVRPIEDEATETALLRLLPLLGPHSSESSSGSNPSTFGYLLRLLYQHLLWRLSDQKGLDTPNYSLVIPLRDEIFSACSQKSRTALLVALDILYLFSPTQEWMSETWRFPADHDFTGLLNNPEGTAASDSALNVGLVRLAASGYDISFKAAAIPIKSFTYSREERALPAIEHIKATLSTGVLTKSLCQGILDAACLLLDNANTPVYEAIEAAPILAKILGTHLKRASDLSNHTETILAFHRDILKHINEHIGDPEAEFRLNAVALIATPYTSLLPPSCALDFGPARTKLGRRKANEHVSAYFKALEKHVGKAATGRRLQLTPQKRKTRSTLGGSTLKQSHSTLLNNQSEDDDEDDGEGDGEEEEAGLMDALEDEQPSSELASETNAFKQMAIDNEREEELAVGIPLRKKQVLRT